MFLRVSVSRCCGVPEFVDATNARRESRNMFEVSICTCCRTQASKIGEKEGFIVSTLHPLHRETFHSGHLCLLAASRAANVDDHLAFTIGVRISLYVDYVDYVEVVITAVRHAFVFSMVCLKPVPRRLLYTIGPTKSHYYYICRSTRKGEGAYCCSPEAWM